MAGLVKKIRIYSSELFKCFNEPELRKVVLEASSRFSLRVRLRLTRQSLSDEIASSLRFSQ